MSDAIEVFAAMPEGPPGMPDRDNARLHEIAALLGTSVAAFGAPPGPRVLHASANGDRWLVALASPGTPIVRHLANPASGGHVTEESLAAFLAHDPGSPQHEALLALLRDALADYLAKA